MDKIERNLVAEENIRKVNKELNPRTSNFQTSAPIVGETNSQKLYMTIQDLETLKKSVMDFSQDYSNEFANLVSHFEKITDDYEALIEKTEYLKSYIEELTERFNKNKGKINGQDIEDITYYTDHENENSFYKKELLPKLNAIYENSINNATNIIEANIVELVSVLEENTTWKSIVKDDFLDSINYYEHFDSVVKTTEAFKIEKVREISGELSDNGTTQISKTDPTKYNKIKAITKGNELVEVTIIGTNENAGGVILETTGSLENFNRRASDNNPIFPELFKSSATSLKNGFVSEMKSNYGNSEYELDSLIEEIYSEMKVLATLTYTNGNKTDKVFVNDEISVVNFGDGSVFVNGYKADFKVDTIFGFQNSIIARTLSGELWAIGDNSFNRLGLGKNKDLVKVWTRLDIGKTIKKCSVYIGYYFSSIITDEGTWIAGNTQICSANEAYSFVKLGFEDMSVCDFTHQLIDSKTGICVYQTDKKEVYICGKNNKGQCGISDVDVVTHPTRVTVADDINFITFCNDSTYILDKNGNLYGTGNNDHGQLGKRYDEVNDYVKEFKLILPNVKYVKGMNSGIVIITKNKELYCCGNNISGRFGIGTTKSYNELTLIRSINETKYVQLKNSVDAADIHYNKLFVIINGKLWVSGKNDYGDLGLGHTNSVKDLTPVEDELGFVFGTQLYKDVSAIISTKKNENGSGEKTIWSLCGDNRTGKIGKPESEIVSYFYETGIVESENSDLLLLNVTKDNSYSLYEDKNRNVQILSVCGLNKSGELGFEAGEKITSFTKTIEGQTLINQFYHAIAPFNAYIGSDNKIYFAGLNIFAQSGTGKDDTYISEFTKISDIEFKDLFIQGNTIFAITMNNDLYVFGDNYLGTSGVEDTIETLIKTPTKSGFEIESKRQVAEIDSELIIIEDEI